MPLSGTLALDAAALVDSNVVPVLGLSTEEAPAHWPIAAMRKEVFRKGEWLFKIGERADRMFYIQSGSVWLPEIKKSVAAGQVVGELGLFAPRTERMASAFCEQDLEVYSMGRDEVIAYFRRDPELALDLIRVSFRRFIENERAEAAAKERLVSELRIAREIQDSLLPGGLPAAVKNRQVNICAGIQPAKEVGGDFYDYFMAGKDRLCVLIGDASGKGVPAALFMAVGKALLKAEASRGGSAAQIVARVNRWLCPDNALCMFTTLLCVTLNTRTGEAECCHAGHELPLLCRANGSVEAIELPRGKALGIDEQARYSSRKVRLKAGDTFFVYTDGVTDALNPRQECFSRKRLLQSLSRSAANDLPQLLENVKQDVAAFIQSEPAADDITMVGLRFLGTRSRSPLCRLTGSQPAGEIVGKGQTRASGPGQHRKTTFRPTDRR